MDGGEGSFPAGGLVRRVRRIARLSQRGLARQSGVATSTVGRIEAGTIMPTLPALVRLLAVAELRLTVVDANGAEVAPLDDLEDLRDRGGRRLPSHVQVIRDPPPGQWYGDEWDGDLQGRPRPDATFHRPQRARQPPGPPLPTSQPPLTGLDRPARLTGSSSSAADGDRAARLTGSDGTPPSTGGPSLPPATAPALAGPEGTPPAGPASAAQAPAEPSYGPWPVGFRRRRKRRRP